MDLNLQYFGFHKSQVANPVPRVAHPDWRHKKVREKEDKFRQRKLKEPHSHIDKTVDYHGWLEQKKRKWKQVREQRKRQRLGSVKSSMQANGQFDSFTSEKQKQSLGRTAVSSFFERQELVLTRHHWQIIQLISSSQPGNYFAWVVVGGVMLKVPITVPRVFYLNSKAPLTEEFPGRRVNKILPHGRRSYNLFEVMIDEEQFRVESRKLAAHLADPEVEGVYETKVSPDFRALLQIGCVCKVDKNAKKRNTQDGWNINELQMITTTECNYLEQSISFFYLYHSTNGESSSNNKLYSPLPAQHSLTPQTPTTNCTLHFQRCTSSLS